MWQWILGDFHTLAAAYQSLIYVAQEYQSRFMSGHGVATILAFRPRLLG